MGDDDSKTGAILKQLQFPVAVLACLQAGSIFYLMIYFDFIKEKYTINDDLFDWFDFILNGFSLFGILPGLLLKWLSPKKTAILGGICIVLGQMGTALMVSSEHDKIKENPTWMLGTICAISGQGACMVLFACLQALMNLMTIQSSHVISTCLFSYYLGADSFILSIKDGLFESVSFTNFTMGLAVTAFVLTLVQGAVVCDVEDSDGFLGKAVALSKGVIYKKTSYMHLFLLFIYTAVLISAYFAGDLANSTAAILLMVIVILNLFVPIAQLLLLNPDRIKAMVGEPSDIEKHLADKGTDISFSDAAQRLDFWYLSFCTMIVIGTSRLFNENADALGLHNNKSQEMIEQTFGVYQVVGAVVMGSLMTFFRSKLAPSMVIIIVIFIALFGQFAMIWPGMVTITEPMRIAVATASFAEGGLLVALSSFVHEEYGTENFGILFGTMLTFGGIGLYAFDEIFFPNIFAWYAVENAYGVSYFKAYGDWNVFLFSTLAVSYFVCGILAIASHVSITRRENTPQGTLGKMKAMF